MSELLEYENALYQKGYKFIAGVDEAGRGPLAGPVVAAAVIFNQWEYPSGIRDSKKLSAQKREKLYYQIRSCCLVYGIGIISHQRIDQINILNATFEAMNQAIHKLKIPPEFVLVDGRDAPIKGFKQLSIIKGDNKSISIAAASIIAKVVRDKLMFLYDKQYPGYNFKSNKGYASKEHQEKIQILGRSPIHRQSFKLWFE